MTAWTASCAAGCPAWASATTGEAVAAGAGAAVVATTGAGAAAIGGRRVRPVAEAGMTAPEVRSESDRPGVAAPMSGSGSGLSAGSATGEADDRPARPSGGLL